MAIIRSTYHGRLAALAVHNQRAADRMGRVQLEASSGMKVMKPSDAPGQVTLLHGLREQMANQQVYEENSQWAFSLHVSADEALTEMSDVIADVRELAVQMASETYSPDVRIDAVNSADGFFDRLLQQLNANLDGRYLFAGQAYDGQAFDPTTGAYLGDNANPSAQVTENLTVDVGWDGSALLQGGGDIVAAVTNLQAALATGVAANVRVVLDDIDLAIDQLAEARTVIGADMQQAEDAMTLAENLRVNLARHESDIVDTDAIESYTALYEYQTAYEAALQVTANSRTNLLFSRL